MADQTNTYDEIPYGDHFFPYTHLDPSRDPGEDLWDRGPERRALSRARTRPRRGGNLLPWPWNFRTPSLSESISPRARLPMARRWSAGSASATLNLRALSITEVDESFGEFDYILCHGVFSWVPEPVREKILAICSRNLAPQGLAYVSYNTYPGWHARGMVRKLLAYHVRRTAPPTPLAQVDGARSFLEEVVRVIPDKASSYARILRTESEYLKGVPNSSLSSMNILKKPIIPSIFTNSWIWPSAWPEVFGGSSFRGMLDNLPEDARETLEEWAGDELGREQYLDILCNRTFRQSLLTHATVQRLVEPTPEALDSLWVGTGLGPVSLDPDAVTSLAPLEFRMSDGEAGLTTNDPLIKAALVVLFEIAPRSLPFATLWERVLSRLGRTADPSNPQESDHLKHALLRCFMSSLIQLRTRPPEFATSVSERPVASPPSANSSRRRRSVEQSPRPNGPARSIRAARPPVARREPRSPGDHQRVAGTRRFRRVLNS